MARAACSSTTAATCWRGSKRKQWRRRAIQTQDADAECLARFQQRKYVKDFEASITVWIGADGTPLGSRLVQNFSGRAFLVVSFSGKSEEQSTYGLAGKRLITTRLESCGNNAGAGEKSEFITVKTLQLLP